MNKIRVVHFSTSAMGGAGLAARRLSQLLGQSGIKSEFYSFERKDYLPGLNEYKLHRTPLGKMKSRVVTFIQIPFNKKIFFSTFSTNSISRKEIFSIANDQETIIHIHNWFNMLSQKQILSLIKRGYKIVLTMHDERFFTGGCHYTFDCTGFLSGCRNCPLLPSAFNNFPAKNVNRVKKRFESVKENIWFISPSMWLANEAKRSLLLKSSNQIVHISNTLGEDLRPNTLKNVKDRIEKTQLVLGVAAMDPTSFVKGGDVLDNLIQAVKTSNIPVRFLYLNKTKGDIESQFWSQIDYVLSLSRAETSSNVILEGKLRGVPALATAVGGVTELLCPPADVSIPPNATAEDILATLQSLLLGKPQVDLSDSNAAFTDYVTSSIPKHIALYQSILEK